MKPVELKKISWESRAVDTISSTLRWTAKGVGSAFSKVAEAWDRTPKAVKLPIAATFIDFKQLKTWQNLAAGVFFLKEVPNVFAAFLLNSPIQLLGKRLQLFSSSFPADPGAPLTDLDMKIGIFEKAQPHLNPILQLQERPIQKPPSLTSARDSAIEQTTDRHLEILIEKVSYLSILQTLHACSGATDSDSASLFNLVDQVSRRDHPSPWQLFISHYGNKISWWGRCKAAIFYAFSWSWIPIIPKTVDAYMKTMLKELRINLKENGEKRNKFINGLLEDADNFFEIYNGAVETYVNDSARRGNLRYYQKNALEHMFEKGEAAQKDSGNIFRIELSRKISASIIDHFAPKVNFGLGFLNGWLNYFIKSALRASILPPLVFNMIDEEHGAIGRFNIPFYIALTKTLTTQISKLQGNLQQEPSDSPPLSGIGIKAFEPIVKKFLRSLDMAECKTIEEARVKLEQLQQGDNAVDAELRKGIQMGIQKGLAVVFDYFSHQENTEALFATLFESAAFSLSGRIPITDQQWSEMATEYEGAKILLKQTGASLCKQILQGAMREVLGGSNRVTTEKFAQKILSQHKTRGVDTYQELLQLCTSLEQKIKQSKDALSDEKSILGELGEMASVLKAFENTERVKITMDQDPQPEIASLPQAERETILRVLYPLYQGSNRVMETILHLQEMQKRHSLGLKRRDALRRMHQALVQISDSPLQDSRSLIQQIFASLQEIQQDDPQTGESLTHLKQEIESIQKLVEKASVTQQALDALSILPPFELESKAGKQKTALERDKNQLSVKKEEMLTKIEQKLQAEKLKADNARLATWTQMQKKGQLLKTDLLHLHHFIHQAKRESLAHLSDQQLGQVAGFLAFLTSFAVENTSVIDPSLKKPIGAALAVLGTLSASIVSNLENFAQKKWLKTSTTILSASGIAGAAAYFSSNDFTQAAQINEFIKKYFSTILTSASAEYAGSRFFTRMIGMGVDVAMPRVNEIFHKTHEHLLTNDVVINAAIKILMNQITALFPPKK